MNINLMPKDKQDVKVKPQKDVAWFGILLVVLFIFLAGLTYFGYLWRQAKNNEAILQNLEGELTARSGLYRQVQNIEANLRQYSTQNKVQKTIYSSYLPPLNVLETIIQLKPDLIWFEKIEFDSLDGSFILTGGAVDYKVLAGFIGRLEQDKNSFSQVKPENATITRNEAGHEYVHFKITGILTKRSEANEQGR